MARKRKARRLEFSDSPWMRWRSNDAKMLTLVLYSSRGLRLERTGRGDGLTGY
jgi:hypothetical protein